jgi:hypothetical protein
MGELAMILQKKQGVLGGPDQDVQIGCQPSQEAAKAGERNCPVTGCCHCLWQCRTQRALSYRIH